MEESFGFYQPVPRERREGEEGEGEDEEKETMEQPAKRAKLESADEERQVAPVPEDEETVEKLWQEFVALEGRRDEILAQLHSLEEQQHQQTSPSPVFASPVYKTNLKKSAGTTSGKKEKKSSPTTRLARRTKSRTLVTEAVRLMTQLTPEAQVNIPVSQQKMLGVNKEHIWSIFDSMFNSQLPKHERITHSSAFKYLFCGLNYLGYKVEPLYGNEAIHKTTRKGGGVKRLSGVMWRDLDSMESRETIRSCLQALTGYGIIVDMDRLKQVIQMHRESDAPAQASVPTSPFHQTFTTTTTTTTTTAVPSPLPTDRKSVV